MWNYTPQSNNSLITLPPLLVDLEPVNARNIAEGDLENKASIFVPSEGDVKVLVQHGVAEVMLRSGVIGAIAAIAPEINNVQFDLLLDTTDAMESIQENVMNKIAKNVPTVNFDTYWIILGNWDCEY